MPKPAKLEEQQIRALTQQVFGCSTRRGLDDLTRKIWREFSNSQNVDTLTRLKLVIQARWAAVDRTPES